MSAAGLQGEQSPLGGGGFVSILLGPYHKSGIGNRKWGGQKGTRLDRERLIRKKKEKNKSSEAGESIEPWTSVKEPPAKGRARTGDSFCQSLQRIVSPQNLNR